MARSDEPIDVLASTIRMSDGTTIRFDEMLDRFKTPRKMRSLLVAVVARRARYAQLNGRFTAEQAASTAIRDAYVVMARIVGMKGKKIAKELGREDGTGPMSTTRVGQLEVRMMRALNEEAIRNGIVISEDLFIDDTGSNEPDPRHAHCNKPV